MKENRRVEALHDRVFGLGGQTRSPFSNPDWPRVLLPCDLRLRCPSFDALRQAALEEGDEAVWIVDRAGLFPDQSPTSVHWDQGAFDEVFSNTTLGHVEVDVFGASATWGMSVSPESFAVLGGREGFMETFTALAGGYQTLKTAFLNAVAANEVGFNLAGTEALRELLSAVGWE